jgi:hypothetical protein
MAGLKRKFSSASYTAPRKVFVSEAVKKYVNKRVARIGERKHIASSDQTTISTTGGDWVLCGLDAGSNENQRIGERVKLEYLKFRATMFGSDTFQRIRIIIYRKTHSQTTAANTFLQFLDPNQFAVLYDEIFAFSGSIAPLCHSVNMQMPISGVVQWNGTGQADTTGGQIWLRVVSDSTVVTHPTFDWCSLVTYRDT